MAGPSFLSTLLLSIITAASIVCLCEALPAWFPPPSLCESKHDTPPYNGGPAPPLPKLPEQYSLKVEANILQKRWTTEVEEHFDTINQRASLAVSFNGSTVYSVFNYRSGERYDIYPNGTCFASTAREDYFGFVKMKSAPKGQRPAMATINQVFKFGGVFNQSYAGKTYVRGIPVNHWTSCREWESWGAKFQLDFYFADPDFISAGGGREIPVRIVLNGTANNVGRRNQSVEGRHRFEHMYEFVSVRPGPPKDEEVFQVPPGVFCWGRKDTKPMPQLPDKFEMNTEVIIPETGMPPRQSYIRYDYEHRLLETGVRMAVRQGSGWGKRRGGSGGSGTSGGSWGNGKSEGSGGSEESERPGGGQGGSGWSGTSWGQGKPGGGQGGPGKPEESEGQGGSGGPGASWGQGRPGGSWNPEGTAKPGAASGGGGSHYRSSTDDDDDEEDLRLMSISTVQDFKTGLVYVLDKMNMTCSAHMMPQDTTQLGMSHGANLFHPATRQTGTTSSFTYQGQTNLREMLVDKWALEENGMTQELYFLAERDRSMWRSSWGSDSSSSSSQQKQRPTMNHNPYPILVGMYIKNNTANSERSMASIFREVFRPDAMQWTGLATTPKPASDDHSDPRRRSVGDQLAYGMKMERILEENLSHKLVHIYNYQPLHTESANFQVSLCYPDHQVSQVMLVVRTSYDTDVLQSFAAFSNNLRQAIAKEADLSLLQVSNLVPMPVSQLGANMTTATFSLLGTPAASVTGQTALVQAKKKLKAAIKRGVTFSVEYATESKSFIVDKELFFIDYDTMTLQNPPADSSGQKISGKAVTDALGASGSGGGGGEGGGGGHSSAAVAGIAIAMLAVGAATGFGGAYYYYQRRRKNDVPYQMTS